MSNNLVSANPVSTLLSKYYPPETLEHTQFSDEIRKDLERGLQSFAGGTLGIMPMICRGQKCSVAAKCPLARNHVTPDAHSCLDGDTDIPLDNAVTKKIKDVRVGDVIISCDVRTGIFERDIVTNTKCSGMRDTFRIKTKGGCKLVCTSDHPLWSFSGEVRRQRGGGWESRIENLPHSWKSIDTMLTFGDRVAVAAELPFFGISSMGEHVPALLGYFITDGSYTAYQTSFTNTNPRYIEEYVHLCQSLGGRCSVLHKPPHVAFGMQKKEAWEVFTIGRDPYNLIRRHSPIDPIKRLYRDCGLYHVRGPQKTIPNEMFMSPEKEICLFLNRFWAGDGCLVSRVDDGKVILSAIDDNPILLHQLHYLLLKIGVRSLIKPRKRNWIIIIADKPSVRNFIRRVGLVYGKETASLRALEASFFHNRIWDGREGNLHWDKIHDIEPVGPRVVYDIAVQKNHNFIANGILVHNCPVELMMIDQWEQEYLTTMDVDPQNKVEREIVRDLVESDLMEWRANADIADAGLFQESIIGFSRQGTPLYNKIVAPAVELKLRLKPRKDRLREEMLSTRRSRAKFKVHEYDKSKRSAELMKRFETSRLQVLEEKELKGGNDQTLVTDGSAS